MENKTVVVNYRKLKDIDLTSFKQDFEEKRISTQLTLITSTLLNTIKHSMKNPRMYLIYMHQSRLGNKKVVGLHGSMVNIKRAESCAESLKRCGERIEQKKI